MANIERIIPAKIADDGSVHYASVTSRPDDSTAACYMVPDRVIPVIFVPGVMGSNLQDSQMNTVWLVDGPNTLATWALKTPAYRKQKLDPTRTQVSDNGKIPTGTQIPESELRRRGWGTVSNMSYGKWLIWLENALNDAHSGTDCGRNGLRAQLIQDFVFPDCERLTNSEVSLSYKYQFPVHAVGYNWLRSNAESAQHLATKIDEFTDYYRSKFGYRCEKVILVTHSMGGLVGRYCSEVIGYNDKILGIVHGVMPATGAATAYKRVKAGSESDGTAKGTVSSYVLGATATEVVPVFAQSPGPLQLLPSPEYGKGWLKIRDGDQIVALPVQDPYSEIYTARHTWWGLLDETLINPLDKEKAHLNRDWSNFEVCINKSVRKFHTQISSKYHAYTYAFYGDDNKHKAWGDAIWKRTTPPAGLWNVKLPALDSVTNLPSLSASPTGTQVVAGKVGQWSTREHFVLQGVNENGDGTVPARSGSAPGRYARACVGFDDVEHEPAYQKLPQQLYALWAIIKIAQNVKGTSLEYKT